MPGIQDKVVIITGASSGIGEATARLLAERGAKVVLAARRTDRIEKIASELTEAGHTALAHTADVTSLEHVQALVAAVIERLGRVDVLVNNAGLMPLATLDKLKIDEWNRMIDVNIRGVLHGIAAVLPHFNERRSGHVVNVSSIAGQKVFPACAVYCATKFAVAAISEGLRQESQHIRSTNISPGVVASELGDTTTDPEAAQFLDAFRDTIITPDAIARAIAFAIEQPDDVDVNEITVRPVTQPS